MNTAHNHHDHDTGHDQGTGGAAGGRVLDVPNPPAVGTVVNGAVNGAVTTTGNGAGQVVNGPGTPVLNTGAELVGPVLDGEIVPDGGTPDTPPAGVLVDSPDTRQVGYLERLRATQRLPLVPDWARTRQGWVDTGRWVGGHYAHLITYHVIRSPRYVAVLAVRATIGAARVTGGALRWVGDLEGLPVRLAAVRSRDPELYLKLSRQRDMRVRVRAPLALAVVVLTGIAIGLGWRVLPGWVPWTTLGVLLVALGIYGAPADRRALLTTAVVSAQHTKLTGEIVTRALLALGVGGINARNRITFPAPITRDGPGWRAEVDLPYGVTATDVLERRAKLASGLRRPLGCVWPEPVHDEHAGRLVIWVGDADLSRAKPTPWPLARKGTTDLFTPVPFGTDQRGRPVLVPLMFANVLIGAMPRFGKTFAMRVLALAAALDVIVELRVFELKGTGDLGAVEGCCHHYASGPDYETIAACVASLDELDTELERRAKVIRGLPATICPENKITPELAKRRDLRLHPIAAFIDECQEVFTHPEYGPRAAELCIRIIKRGPALGILLILATQRPDAKSLPTGVSANVGIRLCLRVMGQLENDMVLGTSAYHNGIRATTFGPKDKGIGYLVGAADDPQVVRSYYIDQPTAQTIGHRARGLRDAAGRLTGHAAGIDTLDATTGPADTLLTDLLVVLPADEDKTWSENLVTRLAAHRPGTYTGWKPEQLAAALKPHGIRTEQVWATPDTGGKRTNRQGVIREHLTTALTHREHGGGTG